MNRFRSVIAGATLLLQALAATAAGYPPINDPPTDEYRYGKLVWIDLVTPDVSGAQKFYGALFGWTFQEMDTGRERYTLAYQADVPVAGIAARTPVAGQKRLSRWIAYMSVADVDRAVADVTGKGGKALIAPRAVEGRGRMAVLADPDGAPFGLVHSSSGDPPDFRAEPGEWIWAVYQSPDATRAAAFYQDLGGYEVVPDDRVGNAASFSLVAAGFERASLVEIPAGLTELKADWLYFVRVPDVAASVARAVELGGHVIVPPRPDLLDGRMAVIADSVGAPLGLMAWDMHDGEGN